MTGLRWFVFGCVVSAMLFLMAAAAYAHEWFTGQENPVTSARCCNGSDCTLIEDKDWSLGAGEVVVRWRDGRDYSMPASQIQPSQDKAGRAAACVWNGVLRCFFVPVSY